MSDTIHTSEGPVADCYLMLADRPLTITKQWCADSGEDPEISGIGSSTVEDLEGDEVTRECIESWCKTSDLTTFIDHVYDMDHVLGRLVGHPTMTVKTANSHGAYPVDGSFYAMEVRSTVAVDNPLAMRAYGYINRSKVKLGWSVGMRLHDGGYEIRKDSRGGMVGLRIHDAPLVEISSTPMPANQTAWAHTMSKALKKRGVLPRDTSTDPGRAELVYVLRNWSDFDAVTANALRRLNLALNKHGLAIAKLNEVAA